MGQELPHHRYNIHDSTDWGGFEVDRLLHLLLFDLLQMREEEKQPNVQRCVRQLHIPL